MKFLGPVLPGAWGEAADACPYATFFHTPAWARIVSKTFPRMHPAGRLFELNGRSVVVPAVEHGAELKGFFHALSSNHLGVYGGPIGNAPLSPAEWGRVLRGLAGARAKRVDVVGNPYAGDEEPEACETWTKRRNFTQVVRLDDWTDEKELMSRYAHLVRNNVHRAERRGYVLRQAETAADVAAYYDLYKDALIRYGSTATNSYPLGLFENILAEDRAKAPIWLAWRDGRIAGGVVGFVHNKRWIAWHSAFAESEFSHGVAKYLHHRLILEARRTGCEVYDFNPSGGHEGTVKFKEMFGAEKRHFWELSRTENPVYAAFRKLRRPVSFNGAAASQEAPPAEARGAGKAPKTYAVAHFRTPYLSITETFIYAVLKNLKPPIQAVVFTESIINPQLFPFPRVVNYALKDNRPLKLLNGAANILLGRNVGLLGSLFTINGIRAIHAHFGPQACDLVDAARMLDIPLVTTFYGFDMSSCAKRDGMTEKYRRLFAAGAVFLAEGPHMREKLVALGCPPEKARIQRIGVDVSAIPYRERVPKAAGEKVVFLFCGRMIEKKGLIVALQAFESLLQDGVDNFEFRVMGDGPLMPDIKNYLEGRAVGARTTLLGYRPHGDFYDELQRADVLVAPSVTAADGNSEGGAPTTILEAQAAGVPVAASEHADIPNVVAPGVSALLSAERDVAGLKTNLRAFIERQDLWAPFGKAGRAFVAAHHDIAVQTGHLQKIYMELIEKKAGSV